MNIRKLSGLDSLGVSYFSISLFITCILLEEIDFEISHFHNDQTSMTLTTTLDRVMWHRALKSRVFTLPVKELEVIFER